eukprot:112905-Chlamydomonas_euryale.AAC.1
MRALGERAGGGGTNTHNLSTPSRRVMTAQSEMRMVRPRFFGCEMRASAMPSTRLSRMMASTECDAIRAADSQQSPGERVP